MIHDKDRGTRGGQKSVLGSLLCLHLYVSCSSGSSCWAPLHRSSQIYRALSSYSISGLLQVHWPTRPYLLQEWNKPQTSPMTSSTPSTLSFGINVGVWVLPILLWVFEDKIFGSLKTNLIKFLGTFRYLPLKIESHVLKINISHNGVVYRISIGTWKSTIWFFFL